MNDSCIKAALLYANYSPTLSYYDDWLDAFEQSDLFDIVSLDICRLATGSKLRKVLKNVDVVILLHSTNGDTLSYLYPLKSQLASRKIPLVSFVGNEVNLPGSPVLEKIDFLRDIRAEYIATQLLEEAGVWLYRSCNNAKVISVPHALNEKTFFPTVPLNQRRIDIGVRTAKYNQYLGDNHRNRLIDYFSHRQDLKSDIDFNQRFKRDEWNRFLNLCKGTVATEAGSYFLQPDDKTMNEIREWIRARDKRAGITIRSDSLLRRLGHMMPWSVRQGLKKIMAKGLVRHEAVAYDEVSFDEIYARFFKDLKPSPVYTKAISSRHFDAIGTKTCQIMIRGRFNDILDEQHYIPVKSDLSDVDDAIEKFNDPQFRENIVNNAYEHIMSGHTHRHRVQHLHRVLTA
ncbi:MAG: glycosyltransferase [Gammaproteobacteria bacterium]